MLKAALPPGISPKHVERGKKDVLPNSPPKLGGVPFARFSANGGVVPQETTPSAPASVASRYFLDGAATPPNLGGELPSPVPVLTAEQSHALDAIHNTNGFRPLLLHGVTGSGKTEIYMRAAEHVLATGKSALILVPEIGLTPQLTDRFSERFPGKTAILHSSLTKRQRIDEWLRIYMGEAPIVIGTRSAVFAPLENIGLIVVDEEHETSYKQEEIPRYNARDTAVMRAKLAGATAVLGSATPSMESFRNTETNKYDSRSLC